MTKIISKKLHYRIHYDRYCWIFCITFFCLLKTTIGYTAVNEYQLQIDFFFDTQSILDTLNKQVTGYRLYMEGEQVCETAQVEPQLQSLGCTIVGEGGSYSFTLAALYDDNSVSPQSGPFLFTLAIKGDLNGDGMVDLKDVIIGLQVLVNFTPNEPVITGDVNNDGRIGLEEVLYCLEKA